MDGVSHSRIPCIIQLNKSHCFVINETLNDIPLLLNDFRVNVLLQLENEKSQMLSFCQNFKSRKGAVTCFKGITCLVQAHLPIHLNPYQVNRD